MSNDLRKLAERRMRQASQTQEMSAEEAARLLHELEVHKEELEIQNEELRRAHLQLEESRDRYLDLYDFAPVGYITLTADGKVVEANLKICSVLGTDRSQLVGMHFVRYCDEDCKSALIALLDDVVSNGNRQSCELKLVKASGATVDALVECSAIVATFGDALNCRMAVFDISEQVQARKALIDKDKSLQSMADALPVLVGYLDTELRYRFSNAAYEKWFALSPENLRGRIIHEVLGSRFNGQSVDHFQAALSGRNVNFEYSYVHPEWGLRQIEVMLVADFDGCGTVQGIHTLCIDVTERKLVQQQNARRHDFAERLVCLSPEEKDVYDLLIRGKSNKAISLDLDIGLRTAERRRKTIFEKLKVASMAELLQQLSDIQGVKPV